MTAKVPPNGLLFFQAARSPRRSLPLVRIAAWLCKAQPVL